MSSLEKPNLVLVPGLLCDAGVWRHQVESLRDYADCTIADVSTDENVVGIAQSVLRSAPPRFCLAGISMGGYICFEIMRQAPERVDRLALIDTQPHRDTPEQADRRRGFIQTARTGGFNEVVSGFSPLLFHENRLSDEVLISEFDNMAHRVGCETFLQQQNAIIHRPDSVPTLNEISCPTLIACGRQDLITPLENSEFMASTISQAELVVIENCGHMSTMEVPDLINQILLDWLTSDRPT